jgi:monoamine oxidase
MFELQGRLPLSYLKGVRTNGVVIVGAGLAGLSAADWLMRRRIPITIFEGRDRIGGRVWTLRDGFVGDAHAEAGGELIDEGQDAILELARKSGLKLVRVLRSGFGEARRTSRGRVQIRPSVQWNEFEEQLQPLVQAFQRGDERWDGPIARAIARRSIADFVRTNRPAQGPGQPLAWLRGLYGADIEDLSLLVLVEQAAAAEKTPGKQKFYRIVGGCDQLTERLAAPVRNRIHLRRRIIAVSQDARGVRITIEGAGGTIEKLAAGHAIITAPASVVRGIAFNPPLPPDQRDAVSLLKYAPVTKTLLQFDRAYWRKSGRPRAFATDLPTGAAWDASEGQVHVRRHALLALMAGGSASAATRALLEDGGPARLLDELRWLGARRGRLLSCRSVTWETDPWARGAYAYFDPAYDPHWRPLLSRPFGRVLFAGEHTSLQWQGFMNGAVESGQRAAAEVVALRGGLSH